MSLLRASVLVLTTILALGAGPALYGQSLQTTVHTGNYPQAITVNPFTDRLYTIDEPANEITIIDGVTNTTSTVSLGTNPQK